MKVFALMMGQLIYPIGGRLISMTKDRQHSWVPYIILAVVSIASFATTWLLPVSDFFKGLASIPGIGALISAVYQLWREQQLHERAVELLHRQQDFALAAASHMADVAYDKHVAFTEAYILRTNQGVDDLFDTGPSKAAMKFASDLRHIRKQHATWLSSEIEEKLICFESTLHRMGVNMAYLDNVAVGEGRSRVVDEVFKAFKTLLDVEKPTPGEETEIVAARITDHLRDVLGVKELTALRQHTTRLALRRVAQSEISS